MKRLAAAALLLTWSVSAQEPLVRVTGVEPQPLLESVLRLKEALQYLGSPLAEEDGRRVESWADGPLDQDLVERIQGVLDPYCLAMVDINPEERVKVFRGPATPRLMQRGWRTYLVKVRNLAGSTAALRVHSPNAGPVLHKSSGQPVPRPRNALSSGQIARRFLDVQLYQRRPMNRTLSGLELEYAIVQVYSRVSGRREFRLAFDIGRGSPDVGARNITNWLAVCDPAVKVVLRVADFDGEPAMASFTITDGIERLPDDLKDRGYRNAMATLEAWDEGTEPALKRLRGVYPLPGRRVASLDEFPDFYFQPQIYRADGEHVYLPAGTYDVEYSRGPEYLPGRRRITVPEGVDSHEERFQLQRWTHLAARGWYSADHHVHAGGCSHYESPEAGVSPLAMFRQAQGEDLNISCVLTWGPCWYAQKQYFEGKVNQLSTDSSLVRYDVEVSGFPSSHAGHLCLLRLKEDDYPGTRSVEDWPSWTLPILRWAREQGGVAGYAHSGWGLEPVDGNDDLPSLAAAPFDGSGANEYIVTWVHDACDFISAGDTPAPWELNIWYHALNCGARTRIAGETDFPCIFDERIGMARSYARLDGALDFDDFTDQLRAGRLYVGDGRSHIIDFEVDDVRMGEAGSELRLEEPSAVRVRAKVTAYLPEERDEVAEHIAAGGVLGRPYWHLEKARTGDGREVRVELIDSGRPVASAMLAADGEWRDIEFDHQVEHSTWLALRIYPSSHTNPVFVLVDGEPIRSSKASAAWCRAAVDRCWENKRDKIRPEERAAAEAAYDVARRYYERVEAAAVRD